MPPKSNNISASMLVAQKNSEHIGLALGKDLYNLLLAEAQRNHLTVSAYLRIMLAENLVKNQEITQEAG